MPNNDRHIAALALLAGKPPEEGPALYAALRRLERRANRINEAACNTPEGAKAQEPAIGKIEAEFLAVFGHFPEGFFVNQDPRGYALKIDNDDAAIPEGIHTDWGGYGCLAPE